ncbi:MAG: hypothetical protein JXB10_00380 [Pirellulales bacterium]|nr:hypothetical protein [Pirellulales bacterium]
MGVVYGSDVYGAVRKVDGTPIVTKFAMLQMLPLYPLESYYLYQLGPEKGTLIPFAGGISHQDIIGIPFARVNKLSVFAAYIRGICGGMILIGSMLLMGYIVGAMCPGNVAETGNTLAMIAGVILGVGLLLAIPTYIITFSTPSRERRIRSVCGRVLGIAADPAQIRKDEAVSIVAAIDALFIEKDIPRANIILGRTENLDPEVLDLLLVRTRAQIQSEGQEEPHESNTNRLLDALAMKRHAS